MSNSKLNAKINLQQAFDGSIVTLDTAFKDAVIKAKNDKLYVPLEALVGKRWVCIDELSGDHFFKKQNGDIQLQVEINKKREVDKFDNTHSISLQQSKTTRESGAARKYCGDAKEIVFNNNAVASIKTDESTAESILAQANLEKLENADEIEF